MDTKSILTALRAERDRLNQAIAALESLDSAGSTIVRQAGTTAAKQSRKGGLTAAGRRRLSAMMKARWAARRKTSARPATKQTRGRRRMSAAGRRKIAEAQRARWAAKKKAESA